MRKPCYGNLVLTTKRQLPQQNKPDYWEVQRNLEVRLVLARLTMAMLVKPETGISLTRGVSFIIERQRRTKSRRFRRQKTP